MCVCVLTALQIKLEKLAGPVKMEYEEIDVEERLEDVKTATAGKDAVFGQAVKEERNAKRFQRRVARQPEQKYHLKDSGKAHLVGQKKPKDSKSAKYYLLKRLEDPDTGKICYTMTPVDDWYDFQRHRNVKSKMTAEEYEKLQTRRHGGKMGKFLARGAAAKASHESVDERKDVFMTKMEARQNQESADARDIEGEMKVNLKVISMGVATEKQKKEKEDLEKSMKNIGQSSSGSKSSNFNVATKAVLKASMKLRADQNPDEEEWENVDQNDGTFAADSDDELAGKYALGLASCPPGTSCF